MAMLAPYGHMVRRYRVRWRYGVACGHTVAYGSSGLRGCIIDLIPRHVSTRRVCIDAPCMHRRAVFLNRRFPCTHLQRLALIPQTDDQMLYAAVARDNPQVR